MIYDIIVIGAGQSGLAAGYYLSKSNLSCLLIDAEKRVGDSWRNRYDSLELFTARSYDSLPGLKLTGNQDECPTKDEQADYLEFYAKKLALPILLETKVEKLEKDGNMFLILTNRGKQLQAKQVIIATGAFTTPFIPHLPGNLSKEIIQIHSKNYRNTSQLKPGMTLVVGAGSSGVQIAVEVAKIYPTLLSFSTTPRLLPKRLLGKSISWWAGKSGILFIVKNSGQDSLIGKFIKRYEHNAVIGTELRDALRNNNLRLVKKVIGYHGNKVIFSDKSSQVVKNIIWATGFSNDFNWISISDICDKNGEVIQKRGITKVPGLYFLGLHWLHTRVSAGLLGVTNDAKFITDYITKNL